MRFLVDECTGPAVADWLRHQNHEVSSMLFINSFAILELSIRMMLSCALP